MKKFKFQLEALMTIRERSEQEARQALANAMREIEELKASVQKLETSKLNATNQWVSSNQEGFKPSERIAYDFQILSLQQQAIALENSIKGADEKRRQAIARLEKAVQEKRIVENMKEKRLREYERELQKHEANEIEDIFNARRKGVWS